MSAGLISSRSKSSLRPTSSTWSCAMRRALARTSGRGRRRIRCAACSCVSCARNSMLHPRMTSARRSVLPRALALPRSTDATCEKERVCRSGTAGGKKKKSPCVLQRRGSPRSALQSFITTRAALRTLQASRRRERSAFIAKLTEKDKKTTEKGRKEAPFGLFERILSKN